MADKPETRRSTEPFVDAEAWERVDFQFDLIVSGLRRSDLMKWMFPATACNIWPFPRLTPTVVYDGS